MHTKQFFVDLSSDAAIKKEKAEARRLRKTNWWLRKLERDSCYYCGKKPSKGEATMDHIHPLSSGGKSTKNNLVVACKQCNTAKKDHLIFDLIKSNQNSDT